MDSALLFSRGDPGRTRLQKPSSCASHVRGTQSYRGRRAAERRGQPVLGFCVTGQGEGRNVGRTGTVLQEVRGAGDLSTQRLFVPSSGSRWNGSSLDNQRWGRDERLTASSLKLFWVVFFLNFGSRLVKQK